MDEYHYVPKMGLSALKNNSSKIIGVAITFKYQNYMKLKTLVNKPIVAIDLINKEKSDYVNVGLQDENGGYIMTKYLLERGYENIYVCARKNIGVDHERWLGYRKAWKGAGRDYLTNDFICLHETEQKRNQDYQMMTKNVGKKTALFSLRIYLRLRQF